MLGWLFVPVPKKTASSQANAQRSSQTLSQISDPQGAIGVNQAPQVSGEASKAKTKEVTKTDVTRPTKPKTQAYIGRHYSKEEVQDLIIKYSNEYGNPAVIPLALEIARCESGFNQFAKNKSSSASGVYQWLSSSWNNQPASTGGISVFDAEANIKAAVWLIAHGKISPWNSSRPCWS